MVFLFTSFDFSRNFSEELSIKNGMICRENAI